MKKIIILPYFGQFNEYFNLWLKSCEYNKNIDWLIITNCIYKDKLPPNIKLINMKFNELVDFIQGKFDFKINLILLSLFGFIYKTSNPLNNSKARKYNSCFFISP